MYARVVRFTDASRERIESAGGNGEGPPEGVNPKQVQVVFDETQKTAVVILFFESEEDMRSADEALQAMDTADTPGTRASVDQGEIVRTIEPD
jgi:hypothetical protein